MNAEILAVNGARARLAQRCLDAMANTESTLVIDPDWQKTVSSLMKLERKLTQRGEIARSREAAKAA